MLEDYYKENKRMLLGKIGGRGIRPQDRNDVLQETFTRALKYYHTYNKDNSPLGAWLNTLMNNAIKDFKKAEKLRGMSTANYEEEPLTGDDLQLNSLLCSNIEEELKGKDPIHRNIIYLSLIKGLTFRDIAEVLNVSRCYAHKVVTKFKASMKVKYRED